MTNRLILGNLNGQMCLRVSRAGYNVMDDSIAAQFMAFDSRSGIMSNLLQTGVISLTWNQYSGLPTHNVAEGYIPLPGGLSRYPPMFGLLRDVNSDRYSVPRAEFITPAWVEGSNIRCRFAFPWEIKNYSIGQVVAYFQYVLMR